MCWKDQIRHGRAHYLITTDLDKYVDFEGILPRWKPLPERILTRIHGVIGLSLEQKCSAILLRIVLLLRQNDMMMQLENLPGP